MAEEELRHDQDVYRAVIERATLEKIAVLMGGMSTEYDVSIVTGKACAQGLRVAGYDVREVMVDRVCHHGQPVGCYAVG